MPLPSSDAVLTLRTLNALQSLAASAPGITVTAGAMALRLEVAPEAVRPILVNIAHDGLLETHVVDECEGCGNEERGILDDDVTAGAAECRVCERQRVHTKLVVFSFARALIEVAQQRVVPKDQVEAPAEPAVSDKPKAGVDSLSEYEKQQLTIGEQHLAAQVQTNSLLRQLWDPATRPLTVAGFIVAFLALGVGAWNGYEAHEANVLTMLHDREAKISEAHARPAKSHAHAPPHDRKRLN
jgi:hypothetical protein